MHPTLQDEIKRHFGSDALNQLEEDALEPMELLKRLEDTHNQLLQSEKMASIGSLAAGVAHEINNPIGFVASNLNSLRDYIEDLVKVVNAFSTAKGDPQLLAEAEEVAKEVDLTFLREDVVILLDECREGVGRVRRIVQDLRDFSHVDHGEWVISDLHQGLDSTLNIVNNEIKYTATVEKDYGLLPEIACIGSQLNQVFMNLLINAAHSIEKNGVITIRTRCDGDWISIAITDTGVGIDPDSLKRIFDPFFTTKPVGKGTGLGLSLSYGIVKRHGGRIEVQSKPKQGSTFTVWLPVRLEKPEVPAASLALQPGNSIG